MARKNGNGAGNGEKPHASTEASAEQIEHERKRANTVRYAHQLMGLEEQVRDLKRDMKQAKVQIKDVRMVIDLQTDAGEDRKRTQRDHINYWLIHLGLELGEQAEMFKQADMGSRHFEAGKTAAYADQPAKPPEHLNQKYAQKWLAGHAEGRTQLNVQRATEGFKPIGEAAGDLVDGITPPPIGPEQQHAAV